MIALSNNLKNVFYPKYVKISESAREHFKSKYPLLFEKKNKDLLKLFGYLHLVCKSYGYFGGDEQIISQKNLAVLEGKEKEFYGNNYVAKHILDRYKTIFTNFEYSGWDKDYCRRVYNDGLDSSDFNCLTKCCNDIKVDLFTGKSKNFCNNEEIKFLKKAENEFKMNYAQQKVFNYMNSLNPALFKTIQENIPEARTFNNNKWTSGTWNREQVKYNMILCNELEENCAGYYVPAENSVRMFSIKASLSSISKEIRKVLCQGMYEIDLQSSQLAILANELKAPKTLEFIEKSMNSEVFEEKSIWNNIEKYLKDNNINYDKTEDKLRWKRAIYSICFGMSKSNLTTLLKTGFVFDSNRKYQKKPDPNARDFSILLNHPIFVELLSLRDNLINKIVEDGFAIDCFGKKYFISEHKPSSILSCLIQAKELDIVSVIFDHAKSQRKYRVMVFQHDGFTMIPLANDKTSNIDNIFKTSFDELNSIVQKTAFDKYGILTKLTCEKL